MVGEVPHLPRVPYFHVNRALKNSMIGFVDFDASRLHEQGIEIDWLKTFAIDFTKQKSK